MTVKQRRKRKRTNDSFAIKKRSNNEKYTNSNQKSARSTFEIYKSNSLQMLMIREDVQIVTMKQREKKVITTIKEPSFSFTFSASFVLLFSRIFSLRPLSFFFISFSFFPYRLVVDGLTWRCFNRRSDGTCSSGKITRTKEIRVVEYVPVTVNRLVNQHALKTKERQRDRKIKKANRTT